MTDQHITFLSLATLVASATNPRKHFDPARLAELADSIKASGVHQPILVRPLPGARVANTGRGVTHEIVAGERRYRASQLAGVATIPAWVRELTDAQVLEIQLIENLLRDDLTPLEEAEGYGHLLRETGIDRVQLAGKIGKSVSYVHARLKLLDLGTDGRAALADGKLDASTALLVARIPDTKLQAEACKRLTAEGYYGRSMSYREAAELVQREYMLRLDRVSFDLKDATLVPDAGPCSTCPKRTGANPDIFTDVGRADMCTDPPCYHAKEAAHQARALAAAKEQGLTVIEGREAKALMPHRWTTRIEGHVRLDDASDSPTGKPLRQVLKKLLASGAAQPVMIANPHEAGELIAAIPNEQLAPLLAQAGQQAAAQKAGDKAESDRKWQEKQAQEEASRALETQWRWQVLQAIWPAAQVREGTHTDADVCVLRAAALHLAQGLNMDKCKALCKLLDLGKVAPKDGVKQWIADTPWPMAALALLVARNDVEYAWWRNASYDDDDDDEGSEPGNTGDGNAQLWAVADAYSVDRAGIEREARFAAKQAEAARKKAEHAEAAKPPVPLPPAAQADGVRGGAKAKKAKAPATRARAEAPKTSAAHASAQISDALNALQAETDQAPAAQGNEAPTAPVGRTAASAAPVDARTAPATDGAAAAPVLERGTRVRIKPSATATRQRPHIGAEGTVRYRVGSRKDTWRVALDGGSSVPVVEAFEGKDLEVLP